MIKAKFFSKKIIYSLLFCFSLCVPVSVFAQETEDTGAEQTVEETAETEKEETPVKKTKEELKAEKAAKKAAAQAEKEKKLEKKDELLGITYVPLEKFTIDTESLQVLLRKSTGTFKIYVKNGKKKTSLFSDQNDGKGSSFFVRFNDEIYRLNESAGAVKTVRKINDSLAQLSYCINKKVQVAIQFEPVSYSENSGDIVKITVFTTNISDKEAAVSLKAVFDTVLGEGYDYHLITSDEKKISGEVSFDSFSEERCLISSDNKASVQIVLNGKSVTKPELVTVAKKDSLLKGDWIPLINENGNFSSINNYNDSAVCVNWAEKNYAPGETKKTVLYIASGKTMMAPRGLDYVDAIDPSTLFDVDIPENEAGEAGIDMEYVNQLIQKISSLKSDPNQVDREEIRRLNDELNSIYEQLRIDE